MWHRGGAAVADDDPRVLPDGCADVIWHDDGTDVLVMVAGPDTRAHLAPLGPTDRMVGIRFAPGIASDVLGVPLDEVRDQRVALDDLWGTRAHGLAEGAAESGQPGHVLVEEVRRRITRPPDGVISAIVARLQSSSGRGLVERLADELSTSPRQLQRRCRAAFGYGPKTLHEVLRFQRALRLARSGRRLADVAADVGFADQPHMARVTRRLAGVSLGQLLGTTPAG